MRLPAPLPPPYDPLVWQQAPWHDRIRMVCAAWTVQGYGAPLPVYLLYLLKVGAFVLAWAFFCGFSPGLGSWSEFGAWALHPVAFQKAILWALLFELLGLGCGSGPLTGRYFPPVGGALYWLRPGTVRLPLFPRLALLGGDRRSLLDVALYVAFVLLVLRALVMDQLRMFYDESTAVGMVGKVLGFRHMHLHDEQLLAAVQARCGFAPGQLRCVFVESQPLHRPMLAWRIVDAATGQVAAGEIAVSELRKRLPWPSSDPWATGTRDDPDIPFEGSGPQ